MTPDLMARVADATICYPRYRYRVWGYGEWIALEGLLAAAPTAGVKPEVQTFPLAQANEALARLRAGQIEGAAVLVMD